MKKLTLLLTVLALLAPAAAFAAKADGPKAKIIAKYDVNKNGKLDPDEIAVLKKDFAATRMANSRASTPTTTASFPTRKLRPSPPAPARSPTRKAARRRPTKPPRRARPLATNPAPARGPSPR